MLCAAGICVHNYYSLMSIKVQLCSNDLYGRLVTWCRLVTCCLVTWCRLSSCLTFVFIVRCLVKWSQTMCVITWRDDWWFMCQLSAHQQPEWVFVWSHQQVWWWLKSRWHCGRSSPAASCWDAPSSSVGPERRSGRSPLEVDSQTPHSLWMDKRVKIWSDLRSKQRFDGVTCLTDGRLPVLQLGVFMCLCICRTTREGE